MNMNTPRVAIVGATGAVGVEILSCLETRNFPLASLKLLASHRSAGKQVAFRGEMLTVQELTADSFGDVDIALFAAGGDISREYAPIAGAAGCVVVDNSSAFRQDPDVPLVVPALDYSMKPRFSYFPPQTRQLLLSLLFHSEVCEVQSQDPLSE